MCFFSIPEPAIRIFLLLDSKVKKFPQIEIVSARDTLEKALIESVHPVPRMLLLQQTGQKWARWDKQQEGEGEKKKNGREKRDLTKSGEACQGGSEIPELYTRSPIQASFVSAGADVVIARTDIFVSCLAKYSESPSLTKVVSSLGCCVLPGC